MIHCRLVILVCTSLLGLYCPALGADWGYEGLESSPAKNESKPQLEGASAQGLIKSSAKTVVLPANNKTAKSSANSATPQVINKTKPAKILSVSSPVQQTRQSAKSVLKSPEEYIDKNKQAALCWLQLFQGSSKEMMPFAQQKQIETYMLGKAKLGGKNEEEVRAILRFWPKFIFQLKDKPELEFQYADLFRALLRIRERQNCEKIAVDGSDCASDSELISNLLGLERVAVPGDPPLTEAAINAYSDMACFIYEQQHQGKTIDANDNRALFARVVSDKFKAAPTAADRQAMANFDLSWAKFKIVWFCANEQTKKILLEKLIKTGAGSTLTVAKDPVMEQILTNWPWPF